MRRILLLSCFLLCAAQLVGEDTFIPDVDWKIVRIERGQVDPPHGVFCITYTIPDVVTDTDLQSLLFVKPTPPGWGPIYGHSSFSGKCRDGLRGWCNGGGNIMRISQEGILYSIRLSWGTHAQQDGTSGKKLGEYQKEILIPWQPSFTYKDDVLSLQADIAWFRKPTNENLAERQKRE
jgi:hypothetical protein